MSKTTIATIAIAAAAGGGALLTDAFLPPEPAPAALVAEATPAPDAEASHLFEDIDRKLDILGDIDRKLAPPPPPVPPSPIPPLQILKQDLRAAIPDKVLADAIAEAIVDLDRIVPGIDTLVPLIPPPLPGIPVIERAQRLYTQLHYAGLRTIPRFASGTSAWVRWKILSADPRATDKEWGIFYASLRT
jgi:hypothetical protein